MIRPTISTGIIPELPERTRRESQSDSTRSPSPRSFLCRRSSGSLCSDISKATPAHRRMSSRSAINCGPEMAEITRWTAVEGPTSSGGTRFRRGRPHAPSSVLPRGWTPAPRNVSPRSLCRGSGRFWAGDAPPCGYHDRPPRWSGALARQKSLAIPGFRTSPGPQRTPG